MWDVQQYTIICPIPLGIVALHLLCVCVHTQLPHPLYPAPALSNHEIRLVWYLFVCMLLCYRDNSSRCAAEDGWCVHCDSRGALDHRMLSTNWLIYLLLFVFCVPAGLYTCKEGKNSPCLVYVSFNHKIYIYWKVELERMESTNLLRVLEEKPEFKSHLKVLGVGKQNSEKADWVQIRESFVSFKPASPSVCCCNMTSRQPWVFVVNLLLVNLWLWTE